MKRFLVAVCSLVAILNGCSKEESNPVDGNNNTNTMPASAFAVKINGQAWTADTVYAMKYALNTSKWDISAEKGQTFMGGSRISMVIPSKEKGTYTVNVSDILNTYLVYAPNFQTPYASREGQVTITESTDKYVKGTFNFTTTDQNTNTVNHTLSEGSFTAHIRQ